MPAKINDTFTGHPQEWIPRIDSDSRDTSARQSAERQTTKTGGKKNCVKRRTSKKCEEGKSRNARAAFERHTGEIPAIPETAGGNCLKGRREANRFK
jgi:hypothetical protein